MLRHNYFHSPYHKHNYLHHYNRLGLAENPWSRHLSSVNIP